MCQLILLHSCGYLNKILVKNNVATDEGNGQNDIYIFMYVVYMRVLKYHRTKMSIIYMLLCSDVTLLIEHSWVSEIDYFEIFSCPQENQLAWQFFE